MVNNQLNNLPFTKFPDYFRKETTDKIAEIINRGECLQLVGLPGSGKSSLLSAILPQRLKDKKFFYYDLNLLTEKSVDAVLELMFTSLFDQSPTLGSSSVIIQKINQFLSQQKTKSKKVIFVFDDFQTLKEPVFVPLLKTLRSFHFHYRPFLNFIFALQREIKDYLPFGPLGTHLSENIVFLPPLNERETLALLKEQEKLSRTKLTDQEKKKIIAQAGGFMRTIKGLAQVKGSGQNFDEVLKKPSLNPHLQYHFEQLLADLEPEEATLKNISLGRLSSTDEENLAALRRLYLIDKDNQPIHTLFFAFLRQKFEKEERGERGESFEDKINLEQRLTASEYKALKYLWVHKGQICTKGDLIVAVWGKTGLEKVADHALDQLLYRLRRKLQLAIPPLSLETIRGRGVRFEFCARQFPNPSG